MRAGGVTCEVVRAGRTQLKASKAGEWGACPASSKNLRPMHAAPSWAACTLPKPRTMGRVVSLASASLEKGGAGRGEHTSV